MTSSLPEEDESDLIATIIYDPITKIPIRIIIPKEPNAESNDEVSTGMSSGS